MRVLRLIFAYWNRRALKSKCDCNCTCIDTTLVCMFLCVGGIGVQQEQCSPSISIHGTPRPIMFPTLVVWAKRL